MTILTRLDDDYGFICACGGFKWQQSGTCWACHMERVRDDAYWAKRTCECGNDKHPSSETCKPCANRKMLGNTHAARSQPESHPWRKKDALLYRRAS